MDKIKLFDTTTLQIEDGASLSRIVHKAKTTAAAATAAAAFTDANLAHVEFWHDDELTGIYDNLGLIGEAATTEEGTEAVQNPLVDGKTVIVALYQK